jgi:hypothetical protein
MRCPRLNAAIRWLKVGDTLDIAHYRLTFAGLFNRQGPNYHETVGRFVVRRMNGDLIGVMEPSRRNFPSRDMTTTEAALMTRGVSQLYLSLGDPLQNGNLAVRLYFKPHVLLIWLGAAIMSAGGALSFSDRRLRVGAPQPAKARAPCARRSDGDETTVAPCTSSHQGCEGLQVRLRRWRNGLAVASVIWWHKRPLRAFPRMRTDARGYP